MNDNFTNIIEAFKNAGVDVRTAEFSITEYSLNTDLSFRFENLAEFIGFLDANREASEQEKEALNAMVVKEGVDTDKYFYVNFYKPKVAEL